MGLHHIIIIVRRNEHVLNPRFSVCDWPKADKNKYEKFSKLAFESDKMYINAKPGRKKITKFRGPYMMQLSVVYNTGMAGVPRIHLDVRVSHT